METDKPFILFDLHGVVFKMDMKKACSIFWQTPKKYRLFITAVNPRFLYHLCKLMYKGSVPEEYILYLAHKFPRLQPYIQTGIAISNAQIPHAGTIAVIKQLKALGIPVFVFSNIGERTFEDLQKKYPDVLALFDKAYYAKAADNYLKKPRAQAYKNCAQYYGCNFEQMIFIDDKRKNIKAATKLGIDSILFRNAEQLLEQLKKRNILK